MLAKVLPGTDLEISPIVLGTGNMGTTQQDAEAFALLDRYYELGGGMLDTALVYGSWVPGAANASELCLGRWLKARGMRGKIKLGTKGAHPLIEHMDQPRVKPADIEADVEQSLAALEVETIDLYWLHRDDPQMPILPILEILEKIRKTGKIRWYGCSNWPVARIKEAAQLAKENGFSGFVANQPQFSFARLNPGVTAADMFSMDEETFCYHQEKAWPCMPYSSQAGGFFGGLVRREGDDGSRKAAHMRRNYGNELNYVRLERAEKLAKEKGVSPIALALAWLLHQPFAVFPIVGCHTLPTLEESLTGAEISLRPDEIKYLTAGAEL